MWWCFESNPGEASIGVSIQNDEQEVDTIAKKIGVATNNVAEYEGLRTALDYCDKNNLKNVQIYLDSLLVVQQVNGKYKVKSKNLKDLYNQCTDLIEKIDNLEIHHVPREQNKRADELANIALDSWFYFGLAVYQYIFFFIYLKIKLLT